MTGFGRAEAEQQNKKITAEIKSVNHRFLDINIRIPRTLGFSEELIRNAVKDRVSRGRVDVFINFSDQAEQGRKACVDIGLMHSYLSAARLAAKELALEDDIMLSHLIQIPDIIQIEEEPLDEEILSVLAKSAVSAALDALTDMRAREGAALRDSMLENLESLEKLRCRIDARKQQTTGEYAEKLKIRISELINGTDIDETRFATEVALMADRADIAEEIVRLETHIAHFKSAMDSEDAVGRKLDFLVQELNREFNTVGSKSQDTKITGAVIEGKSIVERIREQVQNIE